MLSLDFFCGFLPGVGFALAAVALNRRRRSTGTVTPAADDVAPGDKAEPLSVRESAVAVGPSSRVSYTAKQQSAFV